ncbi:MAG: BCCT family transporter [Deltaproteobacteria bacterium]|jgi:BCCT family betaine/carnitine transporter|nr:BCCT family transporter [Deltaproteobacteria bacterium]
MSNGGTIQEKSGGLEKLIFLPGFIIILAVSIIMAFKPDLGQDGVKASLNFVYKNFTSVFLLFGALCFVLLMWLAFGRYGKVKLGRPEDEPEFSYLTWIFMLFTAGVGIGLMIWSIVEPIYYIESPPLDITPFSKQAYEWAHMLPPFHWGFSAWAIYCLPTLPIAYSVFVRREPTLRISSSCRPILGAHVDGPLGKIIEILILLGTLCAVGTSLGLAVPLVAAIISAISGVVDNLQLKAAVMSAWFIICAISLYSGLSKGIKIVSQIKMYLSFGLLLYVLMMGPTSYIFDISVNSVGLLLDNFFRLTFETEPFRTINDNSVGAFPQWWTVFYWAWWVAYAPITALFVARISKGRTIREVVIAECLWGTLGCWIFLMILGSYSLFLESSKIVSVVDIHNKINDATACVAVIGSLPLKQIIVPLYAILCFIFLSTVLNSSAYTLASICTKKLTGEEQPARWQRLMWAAILSLFGMGLLITGGEKALKTVQTSSIVGAIPLIPIIILMVISLLKALREDFPELNVKSSLSQK